MFERAAIGGYNGVDARNFKDEEETQSTTKKYKDTIWSNGM